MAAVLLFAAAFLLSAGSAQAFFGLGNSAELKRSAAFIKYDQYISGKTEGGQVLGESVVRGEKTAFLDVLLNPLKVLIGALPTPSTDTTKETNQADSAAKTYKSYVSYVPLPADVARKSDLLPIADRITETQARVSEFELKLSEAGSRISNNELRINLLEQRPVVSEPAAPAIANNISIQGGRGISVSRSGDEYTIASDISTPTIDRGYVFGQPSAWADSSTNPTIWFNKASVTGDLINIQQSGNPKFLINNSGQVAIGASSASGTLDVRQNANGTTLIYGRRFTDSAPTGDLIKITNAAGDTDIFRVDNSGGVYAGSTFTTGSQTITSTTTPQLRVQYNASNENTVSVSSAGVVTYVANGTTPRMVFIPQSNRTDTFEFQNASGTPVATINTTTPGLNVAGNIQTGGTTRLDNSGNLSNIGTITTSGTITAGNTINLGSGASGGVLSWGSASPLLRAAVGGNVNIQSDNNAKNWIFGASGSTTFPTGPVTGITTLATTDLISTLSASGAAQFSRSINTANNDVGSVQLGGYNSSNANVDYAQISANIVSSTAGAHSGRLRFYTANAGALAGPHMVIDNTGLVGVGTTVPTSLFHTVGTQPASVAANGTAATQVVQITGGKGGNTTGATGQTAGAGALVNITAGAGGDAPAGSTNANGGTITLQGGAPGSGLGVAGSYGNIVLQATGGNVGVGTTTPGYALEVSGNSYFRNTLGIGIDPVNTATLKLTRTAVNTGPEYGILSTFTTNPTITGTSAAGMYLTTNAGGTAARDHIVGIQNIVQAAQSGGSLVWVYGSVQKVSASQGTVTNLLNTLIQSPTIGGTITNNYGIYLEDQRSAGSSLNYSIYSAGGDVALLNSSVGINAVADKTLTILAPSGQGLDITIAGLTHGMTSELPTNAYAYLRDANSGDGGLMMYGASDAAGISGMILKGLIGVADPTDTTPALVLEGSKKSGTTVDAVGSLETAIQMRTGNTNLMTILGSGNVGIGTAGPGFPLDVQSNSGANGIKIRGRSNVGVDEGTLTFTKNDGTTTQGYIQSSGTSLSINSGVSGDINFLATGGSPAYRMVIQNGGNVGIGLTNPSGKLHVSNSDVAVDRASHINISGARTATNYGIVLDNISTNITTDGINKHGLYIDSSGSYTGGAGAATNNYGLYVANVAGADNNYAAYFNGNVGIGTTAPGEKLDVAGTFQVAGSTAGSNRIILKDTSVNARTWEWYPQVNGANTFGMFERVGGKTWYYIDAANSRHVFPEGNVGIGTTNPGGARLKVSANAADWATQIVNAATGGYGLSVDCTACTTATNYTLAAYTNAGTGMFVQNNGNVGIGTTGPESPLHIAGASSGGAITAIIDNAATSALNNEARLRFLVDAGASATVAGATIAAINTNAANGENALYFSTYTGSALTEKVRITSTGNVGVGDTTPDALFDVKGTVCLDLNADEACTDNTSAISDIRLKTNVADITNGLLLVQQLHPVTFTWTGEYNTGTADSLGFLAQEVEAIFPELVITDTAGYKNLDYSKLTAVLAKAIQELNDKVDNLNQSGPDTQTQISVIDNLGVNIKLTVYGEAVFKGGILVEGKLVTAELEVGSPEKPTGITLYDKATGLPYCLEIENGQPISTAGKCGVVLGELVTPQEPAAEAPVVEEAPIEEQTTVEQPTEPAPTEEPTP